MTYNLVDPPVFSLSIAGLCIHLSSNDADLMEKVRHRYRFYSGEGKILNRVNIHLVNDYSGNIEEQITIIEKGLSVIHRTYQGSIDFNKNTSEFQASSIQPLADLEYFLRLVYAVLGYRAGGFLLHSAGVVRAGVASLFIGPSGSGKTTVANLSSDDSVLNDDLIMVLPEPPRWMAFSTPFWNHGKGKNAHPISATLESIYRLVKDRDNRVEPVTKGEAMAELIACIPVLPGAHIFSAGLFQRCSKLLDDVPFYRLHFLPDSSLWDVIRPS